MSTNPPADPPAFADDLLIGAAAIAKFIYNDETDPTRRKVYHLFNTSQIPIGKIGSQYAALRSELITYLKKK